MGIDPQNALLEFSKRIDCAEAIHYNHCRDVTNKSEFYRAEQELIWVRESWIIDKANDDQVLAAIRERNNVYESLSEEIL